jgi:hypothetical protein
LDKTLWREAVLDVAGSAKRDYLDEDMYVSLVSTYSVLKDVPFSFFKEAVRKRVLYSATRVALGKRSNTERSDELTGDPIKYFRALKMAWPVFQVRGRALYNDLVDNEYKHSDLEFLNDFFELPLPSAEVGDLVEVISNSNAKVAKDAVS